MVENLLQALSVLEKCLNYDYSAILCNETLDEPGQTNLPHTFRDIIQQPDLIQLIFKILCADIRNSSSTAIKIKCAQSLQHLSYVRHSIFSDSQARFTFV